MNKLLVIGILGLFLVGGLIYFHTITPEPTLIFETIKPQIICYGGGC